MNSNLEANFEEILRNELINCTDADIPKWSGVFAFWRLSYSDSWDTVKQYVAERDFGGRIDLAVVQEWYDFFAIVRGVRYDYKTGIQKQMLMKFEYFKQVKDFPLKVD